MEWNKKWSEAFGGGEGKCGGREEWMKVIERGGEGETVQEDRVREKRSKTRED